MLGGMIVGTFLLCFVLTPLILRETRRTSSRLEEDTDPDLSRPCCLPSRNLRPWETFVNSQGETEIIQNPAGYLPRMGAGFAMLFEKQADVLSFNYNAFHPMLFQKPRVSNFFMVRSAPHKPERVDNATSKLTDAPCVCVCVVYDRPSTSA